MSRRSLWKSTAITQYGGLTNEPYQPLLQERTRQPFVVQVYLSQFSGTLYRIDATKVNQRGTYLVRNQRNHPQGLQEGERVTEEPNTLIMRFPKGNIVREDEKTVWIQVDDAIGFLQQMTKAFVNPNMAVVSGKDNCEKSDLRN